MLVLGLLFGNAKLIERYAGTSIAGEVIRLDLHSFGLVQFKSFWLFGYGSGAFDQVYKLFFILPEHQSVIMSQTPLNRNVMTWNYIGSWYIHYMGGGAPW